MGPRTHLPCPGRHPCVQPQQATARGSEGNRAPGLLLPCEHPVQPSGHPGLADVSPWGGGGPVSSWRSPSSPVPQP